MGSLDQTLSRHISRRMQLIGKSAFTSSLSKKMMQINDAIWCSRIGRKQFSGGSSSEGTTTSGSDVDKMVVEKNIVILMTDIESLQDSETTCIYFRVNDSRSNHGYIRLAPVNTDERCHEVYGNFEHLMETTDEGKFLSCNKFVNFIKSLSTRPENCPYPAYRHGPCITIEHQNIHGLVPGKLPSDATEADVAFALQCSRWPLLAQEWFERERCHEWPTKETIAKIQKLECHAVPVGDPTSEYPSLEWRLSFLLGELELVWSFNDTQLLTYVILKYLRKRYIEHIAPDQTSSYHMKTVVFWLSENHDVSEWNESNLLSCVKRGLTFFSSCVGAKTLQHFFCKENNLFRHKLENETTRRLVTDKISDIIKDIGYYVLEGGLPETSRLYRDWGSFGRDVGKCIEFWNNDIEIGELYPVCKKVNDTRRKCQATFNTCFAITNCLDPLDILLRISEDFEGHLSTDIDDDYLILVKHFIKIRTGMAMLRKMPQGQCQIEELENRCEKMFRDGAEVCPLIGSLYLATFLWSKRRYTECMDIVTREMCTPKQYMYFGHCSGNPGLTVGLADGRVEQTTDVPVTGEENETINTAFDMILSKEELDILPYPLKFECALFLSYGENILLIHPCVYSYTLLVLASFLKNDLIAARNALERMEEVVLSSGFTHQRYRALNILGFCNSLVGDVDKAVVYYTLSLADTSRLPNVTNAAAYHLPILFFGMYISKNIQEFWRRILQPLDMPSS